MLESKENKIPTTSISSQRAFMLEKHSQMNTSDSVIKDAAVRATGSKVLEKHRIIAGETNEVYEIRTESGQNIIIRIFHGEKSKFEKEKWAFEQCAGVGVPTPEMLLIETSEVEGKSIHICVETKIDGVHLDKAEGIDDDEKKKALLDKVGQMLSKVHSIETNGFGVLDKEGNGKFHSVKELVLGDKYIDREKILRALSEQSYETEVISKAYEILGREAEWYPQSKSRLIHNDLSPAHILTRGENISGMIDFESACGGDPIMEFALWDSKYGKKFPLKYILEGYLKNNPDIIDENFERKLNFWKIYRSLVSLRYCLNEKKEVGIKRGIGRIDEAIKFFS